MPKLTKKWDLCEEGIHAFVDSDDVDEYIITDDPKEAEDFVDRFIDEYPCIIIYGSPLPQYGEDFDVPIHEPNNDYHYGR